MARHESDREDLMQEATALTQRVEIAVGDGTEPITAGFRQTGFLSIYFGADPVFHFDDCGRLRRAYANGKLYRSDGETLAELQRCRSAEETSLLRTSLSVEETAAFLSDMQQHLASFASQLEEGTATVLREIPPGGEAFPLLRASLREILASRCPLSPRLVKRTE